MTATIGLVLVAAIAIRIANQRLAGRSVAVDRWFWRLYVEQSRASGRFPPSLPRYLLDEEQWYPPLFPWLLVRTPPALLRVLEPWLGVVLDVVRLTLVLVVGARLYGGDLGALAASGLAFAVAPILVFYNAQPNPRALAALWLDGLLLAVAWGLQDASLLWHWGAAVLCGALVLLTHKMTTQLLAFVLLGGAVLTGDWRVALLLPASVALALALSGGFYSRVLIAHWDIVTFWNRNWHRLGADPVRESRVYGDPDWQTTGKHHAPGLAGALRHVRRLVRLLPGVWLLALPLALSGALPIGEGAAAVAVVLALQLAFALLTIYVPPLKCLGSGHLYLYNAASPAALLWGLWLREGPTWLAWAAYGVGMAASAVAISAFWIGARRTETRHGAGWRELLEHLRGASSGPVLCLPMGLYDELTYRTGQPVLFGGHGLGFRRLEPVFPVLGLSLAELRSRYGLRWVVARDDALNERLLEDLPTESALRFGTFRLFPIGEALHDPPATTRSPEAI